MMGSVKKMMMIVGCFASGAAVAQSSQEIIPKDLLDLDFQRCVNDCIPGFGETTCKPLCECTVSEFQKRLSYSQYLALSLELSRAELKPDNRTLLDDIANHCTAEIDEQGIQIGSPAEKSAEPTQQK